MIRKIKIRNIASYGESGSELYDLAKINFIYGSNGTGKTTISRIVDNSTRFPDCEIIWKDEMQLETLVYNSDFVEKNFNEPNELGGIFTLGEKDKETLERIESARNELDAINKSISHLKTSLVGKFGNGGKILELKDLEVGFTEECWRLKSKYDDKFKVAFRGYRDKKINFKSKLLVESNRNTADVVPISELEFKAETVFDEDPQPEQEIKIPHWEAMLAYEINPILQKMVIGKSDVNIAAMIERLGNSDWVKLGRDYYDTDKRLCPFCQQPTDASLEENLNDYFDEAFEQDSAAIESLYNSYKQDSMRLRNRLQDVFESSSQRLDNEKLQDLSNLLDSNIEANLLRIKGKRGEPSKLVELDSLSDVKNGVNGLLDNVNYQVQVHNRRVQNLKTEKSKLTQQVWRHLVDEFESKLAEYCNKRQNLNKAIKSLQEQIHEKESERNEKEWEINALEKDTTSIQPTINAINDYLGSFGFQGFILAKSERERFYSIRRPDGSDAKETLSEGEKSFVAFLYFYHLLKGSLSESGTTSDRVVVFDDPVSSFDSNVLFIASQLIKKVFENARNEKGTIKQVIVLTHNVYFHKEASYNSYRSRNDKLKDETFWIVRKDNQKSKIKEYHYNPIQTSYQLLWAELKNVLKNECRDSSTIQNTLRRILESYFTMMGGIDRDKIYGKFEGPEKLICQSLFSWVQAGSHGVDDSLYIQDDNPREYLNVFEQIFEKTGHVAHYKMMMGTEADIAAD